MCVCLYVYLCVYTHTHGRIYLVVGLRPNSSVAPKINRNNSPPVEDHCGPILIVKGSHAVNPILAVQGSLCFGIFYLVYT